MIEWSESHQMIRDTVRKFVEAEIAAAPRGARARRPAALRHPAQAVPRPSAWTRWRASASATRSRRTEGRRGARAGRERREGGEEAPRRRRRLRRDAAHPDHRAVPLLPGHGDGDGRLDGPHRRHHHDARAPSPRRSAGRCRCSPSRRSAPGPSPSRARAPTPSAPCSATARRDGDELPPERQQDLHHQRSLRRHDRVHLQARRAGVEPEGPQDPQLRARPRHARARAVEAPAQDGPALLAHRRAVPDRRAGRPASGCSARPRTAPRPRARAAPRTPSRWSGRGVAAMSLGIIERCLELSVDYAKTRVAWGQPIGEYQLIQLKLAKMEVARMNVQNMVFRTHRDRRRRASR